MMSQSKYVYVDFCDVGSVDARVYVNIIVEDRRCLANQQKDSRITIDWFVRNLLPLKIRAITNFNSGSLIFEYLNRHEVKA